MLTIHFAFLVTMWECLQRQVFAVGSRGIWGGRPWEGASDVWEEWM